MGSALFGDAAPTRREDSVYGDGHQECASESFLRNKANVWQVSFFSESYAMERAELLGFLVQDCAGMTAGSPRALRLPEIEG